MKRVAVALLALMPSLFGSLAAQSLTPSALTPLEKFTVRIRTADGREIQGRLTMVGADSVVVQTVALPMPISLLAIDSLWVQTTHGMKGTVLGATVTGGSFVMLVWLGCHALPGECDWGSPAQAIGKYSVMAAVAAIPGAIVGGFIGVSIPAGWRLRFPR